MRLSYDPGTAPTTFGAPTDEQGSMEPPRGGPPPAPGNGKQPIDTEEHGGCTPCRQKNMDCVYDDPLKGKKRRSCVNCTRYGKCDILDMLKERQADPPCDACASSLPGNCRISYFPSGSRLTVNTLNGEGTKTSAKRACIPCKESRRGCSFSKEPRIMSEQSPEE